MPIDKKAIVKAIDESKKNPKKRNFNQSVDLVLNLAELDLKKPENRINELIELPHSPRKKTTIVVFATGDLALRSKNANVDRIFGKEDLDKLSSDKKSSKKLAKETDFFIAEAPLMSLVGRVLGPFLGPKGKMPTPVPPTAAINEIVERHRKIVRIRVREQMNSQSSIGTEDMSSDMIADNAHTILTRLEVKLPKGLKNIKSAFVKTTMGPLTKIEL